MPITVSPRLQAHIDSIVAGFEVTPEFLTKATNHFMAEMDRGLATTGPSRCMPMIPTYVTSIPKGTEHGVYLAADLGGTNFRVCSVDLCGDGKFKLEQMKAAVPHDYMKNQKAEPLFGFLAGKVAAFLETHHGEKFSSGSIVSDAPVTPPASAMKLKLGFTFSFPVDQSALNRGKLSRWTKGFDIDEVVGQDVVLLFQQALDARNIPVEVVALANDTVGTLLSRAYTAGESRKGDVAIGCIFGTGTNGAYVERLDKITKLDAATRAELEARGVHHMVINTEWGSFDNELQVLPNTKYDASIDAETANPGYHLFEKRISGMFLGEILRVVLVDLYEEGYILQQYKKENRLPHRLTTPWELDSEVLSRIEIDDSLKLKETSLNLHQALRLPTTPEERAVIQQLTRAISKRGAYLSAVPLAGILLKTGHGDTGVEVGADGSVVEFYPGFREMIQEALKMTPLREKAANVHIMIAKDGSGVGSALCASTTD
ncbi:hypothetical protein BABINDRAFT_163948 [Babjeviella inositovora NRRL Y-12698]|uniref:Phosphotransferase n=1 Tax=Babjeviella inositovora NRRL Y-12698 TaxID=984486 RepID=A0A1E3QGX5_9ASCO|nr:uncharacterized protein BABINDRAFT_163948 [Babjeviella inositovora NRRL Y-12698]ODQ76946.1 hypothetical protein BABINDRAFT_163948 [Babjeviella inositovora NRRL Y-12698]